MSEPKPQSFRNHTRFHPPFHFVASAIFLFTLVLTIVFIAMHLKTELLLGMWMLGIWVALFLTAFFARSYPIKVQDRVIRLEERLRLAMMLPEPLKKRIPELTEAQLIALRFASDDEIPTLVEMTLEKKLDGKQIKERIQSWRADHWRV